MRKKSDSAQSATFKFDALLQGDQSTLSHLANLDSLEGQVTKISALGLSIKLDKAPNLEIMIMKNVVTKTAPSLKFDQFYVSQEVKVQIISNKKASVSVSFD
jgi:hypothetical protein